MLGYITERGYYALSPEKKASICNGAGAAGDWKSFLIPNTIYGLNCVEVFNIHDHAYHVGRTKRDKLLADVHLLVNLLIIIIDEGGIFFTPRVYRAATYFVAVYLNGDNAFYLREKGNLHLNKMTHETINNMIRFLVISIATFALIWATTDCSLIKGVAQDIHDHRVVYCGASADSFTKEVAITAIRTHMPLYPESGICTGFEEAWYE